jgi:hypothetical protein
MTTHMCAEEQKGCTGGCGCTLGAKQRWATQIDGETTVQNASGQESATMPREWRESGSFVRSTASLLVVGGRHWVMSMPEAAVRPGISEGQRR